MKQEDLEKFIDFIRTELHVVIQWNNKYMIEEYNNFCKSSACKDKTPKVGNNEVSGSLCDLYEPCRYSKKCKSDCSNDKKHKCYKHTRS